MSRTLAHMRRDGHFNEDEVAVIMHEGRCPKSGDHQIDFADARVRTIIRGHLKAKTDTERDARYVLCLVELLVSRSAKWIPAKLTGGDDIAVTPAFTSELKALAVAVSGRYLVDAVTDGRAIDTLAHAVGADVAIDADYADNASLARSMFVEMHPYLGDPEVTPPSHLDMHVNSILSWYGSATARDAIVKLRRIPLASEAMTRMRRVVGKYSGLYSVTLRRVLHSAGIPITSETDLSEATAADLRAQVTAIREGNVTRARELVRKTTSLSTTYSTRASCRDGLLNYLAIRERELNPEMAVRTLLTLAIAHTKDASDATLLLAFSAAMPATEGTPPDANADLSPDANADPSRRDTNAEESPPPAASLTRNEVVALGRQGFEMTPVANRDAPTHADTHDGAYAESRNVSLLNSDERAVHGVSHRQVHCPQTDPGPDSTVTTAWGGFGGGGVGPFDLAAQHYGCSPDDPATVSLASLTTAEQIASPETDTSASGELIESPAAGLSALLTAVAGAEEATVAAVGEAVVSTPPGIDALREAADNLLEELDSRDVTAGVPAIVPAPVADGTITDIAADATMTTSALRNHATPNPLTEDIRMSSSTTARITYTPHDSAADPRVLPGVAKGGFTGADQLLDRAIEKVASAPPGRIKALESTQVDLLRGTIVMPMTEVLSPPLMRLLGMIALAHGINHITHLSILITFVGALLQLLHEDLEADLANAYSIILAVTQRTLRFRSDGHELAKEDDDKRTCVRLALDAGEAVLFEGQICHSGVEGLLPFVYQGRTLEAWAPDKQKRAVSSIGIHVFGGSGLHLGRIIYSQPCQQDGDTIDPEARETLTRILEAREAESVPPEQAQLARAARQQARDQTRQLAEETVINCVSYLDGVGKITLLFSLTSVEKGLVTPLDGECATNLRDGNLEVLRQCLRERGGGDPSDGDERGGGRWGDDYGGDDYGGDGGHGGGESGHAAAHDPMNSAGAFTFPVPSETPIEELERVTRERLTAVHNSANRSADDIRRELHEVKMGHQTSLSALRQMIDSADAVNQSLSDKIDSNASRVEALKSELKLELSNHSRDASKQQVMLNELKGDVKSISDGIKGEVKACSQDVARQLASFDERLDFTRQTSKDLKELMEDFRKNVGALVSAEVSAAVTREREAGLARKDSLATPDRTNLHLPAGDAGGDGATNSVASGYSTYKPPPTLDLAPAAAPAPAPAGAQPHANDGTEAEAGVITPTTGANGDGAGVGAAAHSRPGMLRNGLNLADGAGDRFSMRGRGTAGALTFSDPLTGQGNQAAEQGRNGLRDYDDVRFDRRQHGGHRSSHVPSGMSRPGSGRAGGGVHPHPSGGRGWGRFGGSRDGGGDRRRSSAPYSGSPAPTSITSHGRTAPYVPDDDGSLPHCCHILLALVDEGEFTMAAATDTFLAWACTSRRRHDVFSVWDAVSTLPRMRTTLGEGGDISVESHTAAEHIFAEVADALYFELIHVRWCLLDEPVTVGSYVCDAVVRVSYLVPHGDGSYGPPSRYMAEVEGELSRHLQLPERLQECVHLHQVQRAVNAVPPAPPLSYVALALHRAVSYQPHYAPARDHAEGMSFGGRGYGGHGYGIDDRYDRDGGYPMHDGKRQLWSKRPSSDIASQLPEYEQRSSMFAYSYAVLKFINPQHSSTLMPVLLGEAQPFQSLMGAVIRKVSASSGMVAAQLANAGIADKLGRLHEATFRQHGASIDLARRDPSRANYGAVADLITAGLLDLRAALGATTVTGQLHDESARLLSRVRELRTDGDLEYICAVDQLFETCKMTWGSAITVRMCKQGMLSSLIPQFVGRMQPAMRDKALDFWNDVVRRYACPGKTRDALPDSLRDEIDRHVSYHDDSSLADIQEYARFDPTLTRDAAAAAYETLARVQRTDGTNPMVRMLRVAADLHFLAPTLIALWHWSGFGKYLLGGYTASVSHVGQSASLMLTDTASHARVDAESDESSDDDAGDSLMAVQTRSRTDTPTERGSGDRGGDRGSGSRGGDGGRDRTARGSTAPSAERRPRFDPHAIDRWASRAQKTTADIRADSEKAADRFEKRLAGLEEFFEKKFATQRAELQLKDKRDRDARSHFYRTVEQAIQNIARHTTDLHQADNARASAAALNAAARTEEKDGMLTPIAEARQLLADSTDDAALLSEADELVDAAAVYAAMRVQKTSPAGRGGGTSDGGDGLKLTHVPPNNFDSYSPAMKEVYAVRDSCTTKEDFDSRIASRLCRNCPRDGRLMPHLEGVCNLSWASGEDAPGGEQLKERRHRRLTENLPRLKRGEPVSMAVVECFECAEH